METLLSLSEDAGLEISTAIKKVCLEGIGFKRRHTEEKCPCASSLGNLNDWVQNQGALGMCCHLPPAPKLHGMHVSLRVKACGIFLDRMEQQPRGQFTNLAMNLVQVCSNVYGREEKFREKVKLILQELCAGLDVELNRMYSQESDARKAFISDCTVTFMSKDSISYF